MKILSFRPKAVAASGLLTLLFPLSCFAQACGGGAAGLRCYLESWILPQVIFALEGVAFLMLFYYGFRLIIESHNEASLTNARKSFIYALVGFACLATMRQIAAAFLLVGSGQGLTSTLLGIPLQDIGFYMARVAEGILALNITLHAFRLLISQGDESNAEKTRKGIVQNIVGIILIFLSDVGVRAVNAGTGGQWIIILELAGLANFLLQLMIAISVIGIMVAGILLIISVDESLKDRAKRIITGTIITLIIALASYTLINIFIDV